MPTDKWIYEQNHIDTNINSEHFINASKCIIYASITPGAESRTPSEFRRIGVIQGYNWGEQRQIEMIFELGSDRPYIIPGRATGQISLARMLIFGKDFVNLLHSGGLTSGSTTELEDPILSLKGIKQSINLMFAAYNNANNELSYSRIFSTCWIQSRNESISAGQVLIAENVNIIYEEIISLTIPKTPAT